MFHRRSRRSRLPLSGGDWRSSLGFSRFRHYIWTQRFLALHSRLRPVLWIGNSSVQHHHEREAETFGNHFELGESQIAFVQLSINDPLLDELIHERFDFLWRRFFQTAGGAFHHIGQTDDGAFSRLRFRSAITETLLAHVRNIVFAKLHDLAAGARVFILLKSALIKIIDK